MDPDQKAIFDLNRCGIKEASRLILLYIDKDEYFNNTISQAKAIQINIALQIGLYDQDSLLSGFVSEKNNSSLIKLSVYHYTVVLDPIERLKDLRGATFILNHSYSTETINDFNQNVVQRPDFGTYNRELSTNGSMEQFLDDMVSCTCKIPYPTYYTVHQQEIMEKDIFSIIFNATTISYEGYELIDKNTTIEVYDVSSWDTMVPKLKEEVEKMTTIKNSTANIIDHLYIPSFDSITHGYSFIYDTELGVNIKSVPGKTVVPYRDSRIKSSITEDLGFILDQIKYTCSQVEKEYGSLRLYYIPFIYGDRLEMHLKDYNINPNELQNKAIDREFSTTETLTSMLYTTARIGDDGETND
jgi:hypothetical protein